MSDGYPLILKKNIYSYITEMNNIRFYCILPFEMPIFLLHAKLSSAHTSMGQITVVLQSNCEWGTCSRSLHSNCLGWGSNPYSPSNRLHTLTNRSLCLRTYYMGEQLVQGCYTVASGRLKPATLWLQGTEHIATQWQIQRKIRPWPHHAIRLWTFGPPSNE